MPLQSSGAISFVNIQTEFGGVNPIGINEYYLNGAYTTGSGAAGIPTSGQISISQFYGKSKIVASSWPPTAVQSSYSNFGLPWGVGSTYYEWQAGASGTNLTRTGGATFNNLGADNYRSRPNFINYQSLILQAKPGDALRFQIRNGAVNANDYEVNSLLLHLGGGWFLVSSVGGNGGHTDTIDYTVPASTAPGSYGIAVYNNYTRANNPYDASANFYSLHIAN
jgi:hypothetical protein